MMNDEIQQIVSFVAETDKLKLVERTNRLVHAKRRENSAEHSWQVALCALLFQEHANEKIDLLKVLSMLLIHDIVEVDVGDVFLHDKHKVEDLYERELAAAERLFGILPNNQAEKFVLLWKEFEMRETPEARFAAALDRLMTPLINAHSNGGTWKEIDVPLEEMLANNNHAQDGSEVVWNLIQGFLQQGYEKGYINSKKMLA
ncbi:MAG: HD domain-containing protein [Bdellovibrionales bacterium]|nr:HD domain-containing protein [Bdellovibrionales bacterium]